MMRWRISVPKLCRLLFAFVEVVLGISASTHWVVTENGRIQSMPETVFQMKRPYDLISFMDQEVRRDSIEQLVKSMQTRRAKIDDQFYSLHSTKDVEDGIKMTDSDCLLRGHYDAELDFHYSTVINVGRREGISDKDFDFENVPLEKQARVPDCKNTFPLDFSMYTFEHLKPMRNRKTLNQKFEIGLIKYIPTSVDLNLFGHQVSHGLIRNATSWLHLHLASVYWRIKGNAHDALECSRRAIVKAPRRYRDIPLQTTGGIFHAANYSKEAAVVLHNAIEYAPTEPLHHLTLANIYAHLGEYNKSVEYYDNAIKYNPDLDVAKKAKHTILCNLKLESSLSALHQQLLDILNELRAYHNEQTEYLSHQEKLKAGYLKSLNSILLHPHEDIHYESLDTLLSHYGQACAQRGVDDPVLSCDVTTEKKAIAQQLQLDYGISLQILKTVEVQAKEIRNKMIKAKFANDDLEQFHQLPDYSKFSTVFMNPTDRPKYHQLQIKQSNEAFEKAEWPSESYCKSLIPFDVNVKQYVPVYLPPENKGYIDAPMTNFLYGTLLHIKGNYSGAIHHLKQTLRVESFAMEGKAMSMLQTIACQEKFSAQPSEPSDNDDDGKMSWCIGYSADNFDNYDPRRSKTFCDDDGNNCKRIECYDTLDKDFDFNALFEM
ncbi:tetratricopeptide repeat protein 17 [Copidosoma floridanum]|uniref:tetratricopeptide repeat protein 17 n=1 Tax=Copidosoma floridanum TaxID=29053 RepID=UPI0006C943CC|nr:tetratricopeptide repeat protein 17 [Copidosoma floridanum]